MQVYCGKQQSQWTSYYLVHSSDGRIRAGRAALPFCPGGCGR